MHLVGTNRGETLSRIVIGAMLLGFVLWRFVISPGCESAPEDRVGDDLRALQTKLRFYADAHGQLPKSFGKLVRPTEGGRKLLESVPLDPWGKAYKLEVEGNRYTITSDGADGVSGSDDDVLASGQWVPRTRD